MLGAAALTAMPKAARTAPAQKHLKNEPKTKLVTIIEKTHFIIEFLELNLSLFGLDNNGMYNKSAFPTSAVLELKQKSFVVGDEALLGWQKHGWLRRRERPVPKLFINILTLRPFIF